ncbi:MAG: lysine--tRNA ligase, partial [Lentisphaeria bacterium]|nr:lysine--tRNA ligase [Lentisphaeria bacterium]
MSQETLKEIMQQRREKVAALREMGINPYPYEFPRTHTIQAAVEQFEDLEEKVTVKLAGRLMTKRVMGKASFAHFMDGSGKMQLYIRRDDVGDEAYQVFKMLDTGDFIGLTGTLVKTRTGEKTLKTDELILLSKNLRPLPNIKEKDGEVFDGFEDKEQRYRKRYLDLIVNPEVKETFVTRAKIFRAVREFFDQNGYLEVETPVLQPLYGGANARPFMTHHNA